jgi:hypothetical protein
MTATAATRPADYTPTGRLALRRVAAGVREIFDGAMLYGGTRADATKSAERYVRSHGWTPAQYNAAVRRPR